ncbi:MAG TPA: hypothetical protein PK348_09570 [Spirochaetota bacterium]|nr:hypothetical protein [Spirochaetota bacterium]
MYTSCNYACQPGFNASCALCCGSHNYTASFHDIDALFKDRFKFFSNMLAKSNDIVSALKACYQELSHITLPAIHPDATQCPFVAYTDSSHTIIGCLLYPYCTNFDYRSLFMGAICKTFSCSVNTVHYADRIQTAAKRCGDWYYYSLIIHDMDLLDLLCNSPAEHTIEECKQKAATMLQNQKACSTGIITKDTAK